MSLFGEHAAGWLALGLLGALADRPRRRDWLTATAGVAAAHGASIGVKRVVRRPRPDDPRVQVLVGTPSRLSFPSAHATSTTAAAVLFGGLLGRRLALACSSRPMALSRLVLGVHYPTDVPRAPCWAPAVAAAHTRACPEGPHDDRHRGPRRTGRARPARPLGVARGVLKTMRPRQWVKNVLVLAAPFVGGDLLTPGIVPDLLVAFVAFSLAASGIYLVNDAKDVAADRAHPTKRFRPIAAGIVVAPAGGRGGRGAARRVGGGEPARVGAAGDRAGRVRRGAAGLLLLAQAPGGARHLHRRLGLPAARDRGRRGHRDPAVAVVPAGGGLRVAVHGGRQAVRRDDAGRADRREDPQVAGELHGAATCGSCGRSRRRC